MTNKTKTVKPVLPVIDTIAGLPITQMENGYTLITFKVGSGEVAMGTRKVKAVLDNLDAAREFVAKHHVATTTKPAADPAVHAQLTAANAVLLAEIATLKAAMATPAQTPLRTAKTPA